MTASATVASLNDTARVRLTPRGREIRDEAWAETRANAPHILPAESPHADDADGVSEWLVWQLMAVFGPHLHHAADQPFEGGRIELTANR